MMPSGTMKNNTVILIVFIKPRMKGQKMNYLQVN